MGCQFQRSSLQYAIEKQRIWLTNREAYKVIYCTARKHNRYLETGEMQKIWTADAQVTAFYISQLSSQIPKVFYKNVIHALGLFMYVLQI